MYAERFFKAIWDFRLVWVHFGSNVNVLLGIPIAGKVEEKEELEKLSKWGTFFSYVLVDCEIFTYLKNKE